MPLIGNVLKPLAKSVLTPLGLPAAEITDAATDKKMFRSGFTTPIVSLFFSFFLLFFTYLKKNPSKNHWFGQKRGVSKRAVPLMYLIINLRTSWLELLEVADWEPYNKKINFFFNF